MLPACTVAALRPKMPFDSLEIQSPRMHTACMCMHIRSNQCKNGAADEEDPGLRPPACKVADMDAVVDAILILRRQIHSVRTDVPC